MNTRVKINKLLAVLIWHELQFNKYRNYTRTDKIVIRLISIRRDKTVLLLKNNNKFKKSGMLSNDIAN